MNYLAVGKDSITPGLHFEISTQLQPYGHVDTCILWYVLSNPDPSKPFNTYYVDYCLLEQFSITLVQGFCFTTLNWKLL